MTAATHVRPYTLDSNEGKTVDHFGGPITFKAEARQTDGVLGMIEYSAPAGVGTPLHIHTREDESFYVVEGRLTLTVDGAESVAGAGSFAFLPRNVAHAWRNDGPEPARFVVIVTPGGFEGFFQDFADYETAHGGELPGVEWLIECLGGYGIQVPPPQ